MSKLKDKTKQKTPNAESAWRLSIVALVGAFQCESTREERADGLSRYKRKHVPPYVVGSGEKKKKPARLTRI